MEDQTHAANYNALRTKEYLFIDHSALDDVPPADDRPSSTTWRRIPDR